MENNGTEYVKMVNHNKKLIRTELLFSPVLIVLPVVISILLIQDWYHRGYLIGSSTYDGELVLAMIILIGNILFDIPFIKSIIRHKRKI